MNWKKAAELVKAGKAKKINGFPVLPMDVSAAEGVVFLIPEPKSPHGVDVTPDGKYITVSGKLDIHTWVYSFDKIQKAIAAKKFADKDPYGLPVIGLEDALHTQVALGLGPLHTQYDSRPGIAYTSLYVDSMVAKWDYVNGKVLDKMPVHYNIGHIMAMHGDTVKPRGKYVVAINKLAIDRFNPVGPLHPQNLQLIDISNDKMQLLYDMPIPLGEPHYVVAIDTTLLKPIVRYPTGTNSRTDEISPFKTRAGEEKITRNGKKVEVFGTEIRSHITPEIIEVDEGDQVTIHLTNLERAEDQTHGFTVGKYNVNGSLEPGKTATFSFVANKPGVFPYYCTEFCSALHLEMEGYLLVKPKGYKGGPVQAKAGVEYSQAEYEKQLKQNQDTQQVIDEVVAFITARDYKQYPMVAAQVDDATDQLDKVPDVKAKADAAAAKGDWNNAMLWANQWYQYQVKAADIGLRAKAQLEQLGAKPIK